MEASTGKKIAVVIPSYKVIDHIMGVINTMPSQVDKIYVIDDKCPVGSGDFVEANNTDPRVVVVRNEVNKGVGGAVMHGYRRAIEDGMDVIVKVDGDGQMDPRLIPKFIAPIVNEQADYTKGNRFYDLRHISRMPFIRLFGNAVLSFMTKFSTGYWDSFDPTNGFTAIDSRIAKVLPFEKISERYFFETDILFRLNTFRANVVDIPMDAHYADEESNLKISKILSEFLFKHIRNFGKRIFYNYFLRDLSIASLELVFGVGMVMFGVIFGGYRWALSAINNTPTPFGTIMLAALPVLVGIQLVLAFLSYDYAATPKTPVSPKLDPKLGV